MINDVVVRGDRLPILGSLAAGHSTSRGAPRVLVWGVDLSDAETRRRAHKHLRLECRSVAAVAAANPSLAHVFIVYSHGAALREGSCLDFAAQAAARLHAEFERTRGRFVEVILLDATGWEDAEALRHRIAETVSTPAGVAGDLALGWHDITDASIHRAAMARLC